MLRLFKLVFFIIFIIKIYLFFKKIKSEKRTEFSKIRKTYSLENKHQADHTLIIQVLDEIEEWKEKIKEKEIENKSFFEELNKTKKEMDFLIHKNKSLSDEYSKIQEGINNVKASINKLDIEVKNDVYINQIIELIGFVYLFLKLDKKIRNFTEAEEKKKKDQQQQQQHNKGIKGIAEQIEEENKIVDGSFEKTENFDLSIGQQAENETNIVGQTIGGKPDPRNISNE